MVTGMRRIIIVGCAGSGKSTLAKKLGEQLRIPVVHLDALAWDPGWKALTTEAFRARLEHAISGDAWITDGNYAVTSFDLRMPRADLVIWVQRPLTKCFWRVFKRAFKSYSSADEDLAPQCKEWFDRRFLERLRYIVHFNRVNRPRIERLRLSHGPNVPVVVLHNDREISAFLASARRENG
jgi:adenylate kinase family enzyme